jgi:2-oxoglutarate dehydrogenase E2 component (dihydrolipoamide succinyltransferase)
VANTAGADRRRRPEREKEMPTNVEIPSLGESVTEAVIIKWHKNDGDRVKANEPLCELETDKANVDLPAPADGVLSRVKEEGDTVQVGEVVARIDGAAPEAGEKSDGKRSAQARPSEKRAEQTKRAAPAKPEDLSPAVRNLVEEHNLDVNELAGTGPGGRITKEDVQRHLDERQPEQLTEAHPDQEEQEQEQPPAEPEPTPMQPGAAPGTRGVMKHAPAKPPTAPISFDAQGVRRVSMSKIRRRIADRLVSAQQNAAILTTFNEIDMSAVFDLRSKFKERFTEVHNVSLGLMSFFCRAVVLALREFPRLNAFIENDEIVYHQHVHLGIAVSTERGLAVPVLRSVDEMSFAKVEAEIKRVAIAVREGKLALHELSGGTFTITNGGIFGSLLSTPILNPPQSGILGMHAIQKRPVVIDDGIEVRPMMYVALSYDHRLVDGRESVSFLVRVKQYLEDPARMMLEI